MTTARKVALVEGVRTEFGLGAALSAMGLPRSTWYYQAQRIPYGRKHEAMKDPLFQIAEKLPEYGYRRAAAEVSEQLGRTVNHKVVQKLQRIWGLRHLRGYRLPRPSGVRKLVTEVGARANLVAELEEIGPFEVLYTDFTELVYSSGKLHLIPIIDHATKLALGWSVGPTPVTEIALRAWRRATAMLRRLRVPIAGIIVHHDRDPVFTSYAWTRQLLLRDRARVSYALRGAPDNPEMESFNSRFKEENRSLFAEAEDHEGLVAVVNERMNHYNRRRKHSTLGNQAPLAYARSVLK
jgi:transposase InsO family protein